MDYWQQYSGTIMGSQAHDRSGRPGGIRPASAVASALGLMAALASAASLASGTLYLSVDELICDVERIVCVAGTLGYDVNDRLLWLRGRVQFATVPGLLQITVKGSNRLGHVRYAPMEIELRGRATEIIDFQMIPDDPDVANWAIDHIVFLPGKKQ
jgi:hypothetical protein